MNVNSVVAVGLAVILSCVLPEAVNAGQPGTTDKVFNRRFIQKIKPMMPYEQLVKIVGTEGTKTGEDKRSLTATAVYHWNGERNSALDVKVAAGKVVEATVTSPKKRKLSLGKSGETIESGKY